MAAVESGISALRSDDEPDRSSSFNGNRFYENEVELA